MGGEKKKHSQPVSKAYCKMVDKAKGWGGGGWVGSYEDGTKKEKRSKLVQTILQSRRLINLYWSFSCASDDQIETSVITY